MVKKLKNSFITSIEMPDFLFISCICIFVYALSSLNVYVNQLAFFLDKAIGSYARPLITCLFCMGWFYTGVYFWLTFNYDILEYVKTTIQVCAINYIAAQIIKE